MDFSNLTIADVIHALTAIVTIFSLIAAVTDTPKDDGIAKKLYKIVDMLAINVGKAKEK